jgi:hypothetical protein
MYEVVFLFGAIAIAGGFGADETRPPETDLQRFIRMQEPDRTDLWVQFQQRGAFAGKEAETETGRRLLLFRDDLRARLVESGRMSAADFDAKFGPGARPNYCAISKEVTAASFGSPDKVWKFSRCKV